MYADDTKIFMKINSIADCMLLQDDLDRLGCYYAKNRIGINLTKCSLVTFTRKKLPINYNYAINNILLNRVNTVKDLGVLIDSKLSFSDHIDAITNKAFKSLGFIMRVTQPFSDLGCLKILYYSYVRSILEYCSPIWSPHYITYIQKLENIQSKFVKYLNYRYSRSFLDYSDSCSHYKLMSLEQRRNLSDMSFLHGLCNGYIDSTVLAGKILCLYVPKKRTRHATQSLFAVTKTKCNYAQHSLVSRLQTSYNKKFNTIDIFHTNKYSFKKEVCTLINNSHLKSLK